MTPAGSLTDSHGRTIRDLRVSVTDRCNFRCLYCLPDSDPLSTGASAAPRWQPRENMLSFEEIERFVRTAVALGIRKVRLTGGEPLLRKDIETLVGRIAAIPGVEDLAMTTNGFLFCSKGSALRSAGLQRVNFSLDSLDQENFRRITGKDGLPAVLRGIRLAQELGLNPVRVNAVIIRGLNDHEIETLAEFASDQALQLRFIEFMPLDSGRDWQRDQVVPAEEILSRLRPHHRLTPLPPVQASETARRWALDDGRCEIGVIASITQPFCGHCNRIRVTAEGKVRTCLFGHVEHDLRALLREPCTDEALANWLREVVRSKEDRHHIGEPGFVQPARTMSCIGG